MKTDLRGLTIQEIELFFKELGEPAYRAKQAVYWLYEKGVSGIDEMTNLSHELRNKCKDKAFISTLKIVKKQVSQTDGTVKYLFESPDSHRFETVLIPEKKRMTLCLSTQIGCQVKCCFCLTGDSAFVRNLTAAEIIGQIISVQKDIGEEKRISNVVFMGMGEPLLNYDNLIKAVTIISADWGIGIGVRKITISTAGIVPAIRKLADAGIGVRLAISLNAATNQKRDKMMPINKKYPLKELLKAAKYFASTASRYLTFEYVLIAGENDSLDDARELTKLIRDIPAKINLIVYNANPYKPYAPSDKDQLEAFKKILIPHFSAVTLRRSGGQDILAACGQLRGKA